MLGGDLWVTKIDLQNAYWGTVMPEGMQSAFVFELQGVKYGLIRLPFGWSRSPAIFQKKLQQCIEESIGNYILILKFQYLDDILLLGKGFDSLAAATKRLCDHIKKKGWILNDKKLIATPCKAVDWLGKRVTISDDKITITIMEDTVVEITALILWVTAKPFPQRVLKSLAGLLSWATIHSRLALPFLHAAHVFLKGHRYPHPPQQVRSQLVKALWFASLPVNKKAFAPAGKPWHDLPWVFADAAAVEGHCGLVISWPDASIEVFSHPLPQDMCSVEQQQLAELYVVKRALIWAALHDVKEVVYIADNLASLYSTAKFSTPSLHSRRSKILRQMAGLYGPNFWCTMRLAHTASFLNPADAPSRPSLQVPHENTVALTKWLRNKPGLIAWDIDAWPGHKKTIMEDLESCGGVLLLGCLPPSGLFHHPPNSSSLSLFYLFSPLRDPSFSISS